MWHVFIEFGGMVFWLLVGIAVLVELLLVSRDKVAEAFGVLGVFAVVMALFSSMPIVGYVTYGWKATLAWVGAYVGIGILWSLVRWVLFALKRKNYFYDRKEAWFDSEKAEFRLESKIIDSWSPAAKMTFFNFFINSWNDSPFCRGDGYWNEIDVPGNLVRMADSPEAVKQTSAKVFDAVVPKARQNKAKISAWVSFWPLSILCYFLEDLVVDAIKAIVRGVCRIASAINSALFAGMKKDLGA
jgi:hypothetical protein